MADWQGELLLANGWAHYCGRAGDTSFHSHYPAQIIFAGQGSVTVNLEDGQLSDRYVSVSSRMQHQLLQTETTVDILFVEPTLLPDEGNIPTSLVDWLTYLRGAKPVTEDGRLTAALTEVDAMLEGKVTLDVIARSAGMSKSLFTKKFRAVTGLPLRRYVLWRRLYRAAQSIGGGDDLTAAAHKAGFADSAHFSRTMRETFGVSPSGGLQQLRMTVL